MRTRSRGVDSGHTQRNFDFSPCSLLVASQPTLYRFVWLMFDAQCGLRAISRGAEEWGPNLVRRQFLPLESLEETPSRKDGVSAETERQQRLWACCFIQEGGVRLGLPQQAICTAQVLLGRFYLKQSLAK